MENTAVQLNGKVLPQAIELEEYILGALIGDTTAYLEVMPIFKSNDVFYKESHQVIFKAIAALYYNNKPIDMITVIEQLKADGALMDAGGEYRLVQLSQKIDSAANIEHYARVLMQYWIKRELIKNCHAIEQLCYEGDSDSLNVLERYQKMGDHVVEAISSGERQMSYAAAISGVEQRVEMLSNQAPGEFSGVPTGFAKIDKFTGGWQPSDLIIVAARPGMGKTALVLKNVVECGLRNIPVGFFSLEMSAHQLAARTIAINSNFHLSMLIRDGFEKQKYFTTLHQTTHQMKQFPIYIDDTPSQDIRDIISRARIWKRKHDIQLLVVDYIQLATDVSKKNNREQEIASISRNLKMLAKELDIPVLALSQLSRSVEARTDKHPKLSDLRESGAIEQDADIVTFIYREHYYNPDAVLSPEMQSMGANAELNFAKYRSGSLETKALYFDKNKVKFMDPSEVETEDDVPY